MLRSTLLLTVVCWGGWAWSEEVQPRGIPYRPDPPPAIDGRLDDWRQTPVWQTIERREQVIYGAARWTSLTDLSAKIHLAWREECLYLAAEATDDIHRQQGRGKAMFRGDHVTLYLDVAPDLESARTMWGVGQVQLGFSPGGLTRSGDPLVDLPPEAVVFSPEGKPATGVQIAAEKTDSGYTIEAAVPWSLIFALAGRSSERPTMGLRLGVEVGASDCDASDPAQETMMTVETAPWRRARDRMLPAALATSDGRVEPAIAGRDLLAAIRLAPGERHALSFASLAVPDGRELVLALKARLDTPRVAGYTPALRVSVNGVDLEPARLLNRQREETTVGGRVMMPAAGVAFNVPYSPDFDAPNRHPSYALRSGPQLCRYELAITDLARPGENALALRNAARPELKRDLVLADVRLEVRAKAVPRKKRPAPTGPLPIVRPETRRADYALSEEKDGALVIAVAGETFRVTSEFSTPTPGWVHGSNRYFEHQRALERRPEAIVVRDTFVNRTAENLPIMQRHRAAASGKFKQAWLAGLSPAALTSQTADPANPTSYGQTDKAGVGLFPWDDVFQAHVTNFSAPDGVGLADNHFVLRPGARHTSEWVIVPLAQPGYYAFLNAARRLRGVNFTLDGGFAFLRADPKLTFGKWTDQQFLDFIGNKSARFLCSGLSWPRYKGRYPHGTAFQQMDWSVTRKQIAHLREIAPAALHLKYFHCFIDVCDESPQRYADARLLAADGGQADYGKAHDRIYVPTAENSFGRDVAKNVELILAPQPAGLGCDGVYWDEFEYSRYPYAYHVSTDGDGGLPWDGASADIDPRSMKITRLKSSVTLLSQPWRLALVRRIMQKHTLVANGQPHTRSMTDMHFPRFVETGSISNCAHAQFFSPIALGDHLTERGDLDAYRTMLRALDFGCLYYWYDDVHVPVTHPHLTGYMFPITPVELREGCVIGKERIITNRSGLYGWGDAAPCAVHVFDDQGREVPDFRAPIVVRDGGKFVELRLPEDYSAAIVCQQRQ